MAIQHSRMIGKRGVALNSQEFNIYRKRREPKTESVGVEQIQSY